MTPFTAGLCFTLSSMSVTARFFPSSWLPHAVDLPAVLQVGVAQCQDFTPQPTPFLSLSDISRNTVKSRSRKLLQTSSLSTVGFFFSIDRSIDESIELCVVSFSVAPHKLSASSLAFSDGENMHFRSTASTAHFTSLLTLRSRRPFERVFFLSSNETSDRHLALT
jgi:hypothetical protein